MEDVWKTERQVNTASLQWQEENNISLAVGISGVVCHFIHAVSLYRAVIAFTTLSVFTADINCYYLRAIPRERVKKKTIFSPKLKTLVIIVKTPKYFDFILF